MKYASLNETAGYYKVAARASMTWHILEHEALQRLAGAVRRLSRLAGEVDDDAGWREFLYPARRARNIATTVPLPLSHKDLGLSELFDRLEQNLRALRVYGGDDAALLGAEVLAAGRELAADHDAPVLRGVLGAVQNDDEGSTCGVLIPIADYKISVARYLRDSGARPDHMVLSRHDIADLRPLDRLVVIGPLYWYDDHQYVLTAPRAEQIAVLSWAWYREAQPRRTVLEDSRGGALVDLPPRPDAGTPVTIRAEDERTSIDWTSVARELSTTDERESWDAVSARAAVLAGRYGTLLPESGDRLVWLLDPSALPEHRVARVDVADLEPGHVIILRTSGGGDLIVPIADELLGAEAGRLRELQDRWKMHLRTWVYKRASIRRAAEELRRLGCTRANPQNLQNWMGDRSLRTEDRRDWQALMTAVSLDADEDAIWRAMGKLHSAHSEAGHSIGRRLREMANTGPLDVLLSTGSQRFSLARSGSVTAFRIEGFSPALVQCVPGRLMVPIKVRDAWLT